MRLASDPTLPDFPEFVKIIEEYGLSPDVQPNLQQFEDGWVHAWNNAVGQ